jgi:hypothetical protein
MCRSGFCVWGRQGLGNQGKNRVGEGWGKVGGGRVILQQSVGCSKSHDVCMAVCSSTTAQPSIMGHSTVTCEDVAYTGTAQLTDMAQQSELFIGRRALTTSQP